jgi:large subunit ribosomal protein L6
MSRIGKAPVPVPAGVTIDIKSSNVAVKGPKGNLNINLRPEVKVKVEGNEAIVELTGAGGAREARAYHGLTRALINNMVVGVTKGFEKKLEVVGVGWNAKAQGKKVVLNIGFCHPVDVNMVEGVTVETPAPNQIILTGPDRQAVGQMAAQIRAVRKPEPYKGKGIRYHDEVVRRKAGKSFGA